RLERRIFSETAFLHCARHVPGEVCRILKTTDRKREWNSRLLQRRGDLGSILTHARDSNRRIGFATASPTATESSATATGSLEVRRHDHSCLGSFQIV